MNYNAPPSPKLLPGEVVLFTNSNRQYEVSFWYPDRMFEFEPINGEGRSYLFSEKDVRIGIIEGRIKTVKMPKWWSSIK